MLNKNNKRGFLQISFTWLFAIIIGAIILVFAIYASVKLIGTEGTVSSTETAEEIAVLLNPLETEFGAEKITSLSLPIESQIMNECEDFADFGEQSISVAQKSRGEFSDTGLASTSHNKYIFSDSEVQGKNFYLFSKPFEFPFKVASLIFLTSAEKTYCFRNAPDEIEEELSDLGQENIVLNSCDSDNLIVCFEDSEDCDVIVDSGSRSVENREGMVYYETDALMYGAIFSDKEIYECQVKRLMVRIKELSLIYQEKENLIAEKDCFSDMGIELQTLAAEASALQDSSDLIFVKSAAEDLENKNDRAYCELW
jgi:hypothetical protein